MKQAYVRYGQGAVPERAKLADSVSIVACEHGLLCIRFHDPATTTDPGRIFAAAYLDAKQSAAVGEEYANAMDGLRRVECDGRH